jgi:hypothetical protein
MAFSFHSRFMIVSLRSQVVSAALLSSSCCFLPSLLYQPPISVIIGRLTLARNSSPALIVRRTAPFHLLTGDPPPLLEKRSLISHCSHVQRSYSTNRGRQQVQRRIILLLTFTRQHHSPRSHRQPPNSLSSPLMPPVPRHPAQLAVLLLKSHPRHLSSSLRS